MNELLDGGSTPPSSTKWKSRAYRFCFYMLCFLFKLQVDGLTRDDRIRCMYDVSDSISYLGRHRHIYER